MLLSRVFIDLDTFLVTLRLSVLVYGSIICVELGIWEELQVHKIEL
jgi:hypothetical protein